MPLVGSFSGLGIAPRLSTLEATTLRTILVTFNEAMLANAALASPASYTLTPQGPAIARSVLTALPIVGHPTQVLLTVDGDLTIGVDTYEVAIVGVSDAAGNLIDPAFDTLLLSVPPHFSDIEDHCALALARRLAQYRGQPNIEALICLWGDRYTAVEQALQDIRAFSSLDSAYGIGLDRLGDKLGLVRHGLSDTVYRIRLRARAAVIGARGSPDELLAILTTLIAGDTVTRTLTEAYPAGVIVEAYPLTLMDGEAFALMLQDAAPAAVRLVFQHDGGFHLFGWEEDGTTFGWGEDSTDVAGGIWAEAT